VDGLNIGNGKSDGLLEDLQVELDVLFGGPEALERRLLRKPCPEMIDKDGLDWIRTSLEAKRCVLFCFVLFR